jgi:hypothetical protein
MLRTQPLTHPILPDSEGLYTLPLGETTITTRQHLVGSRRSTAKIARLVAVLSSLPPGFPSDSPSSIISMTVADVAVRALLQPGDLGLVNPTQCVLHLWTVASAMGHPSLQQALDILLGYGGEATVLYKASFVMPCVTEPGLGDDNTFQ